MLLIDYIALCTWEEQVLKIADVVVDVAVACAVCVWRRQHACCAIPGQECKGRPSDHDPHSAKHLIRHAPRHYDV